MNSLFKIELLSLKRRLESLGIRLSIFITLYCIISVLVGLYVLSKSPLIAYFIWFIPLSVSEKMQVKGITDWRRMLSNEDGLIVIDTLLYFFCAFPILCLLLYHAHFIGFILVLLVGVIYGLTRRLNYELGLPVLKLFSHIPFEFPISFRFYWPLYIIGAYVCYQAFLVDNYTLGVVTCCFLTFLISSFYQLLEPSIYVWTFTGKPNDFLKYKLRYCFRGTLIISGIYWVSVIISFPEQILITAGLLILMVSYLPLFIMLKYSKYPNSASIIDQLLAITSCLVPPMHLFMTYVLYRKSTKSLKPILV